MKNKLLCLLLLSSFAFYSQSGKVIKVKDGDTIVVLGDDNVQYTIRVADIDCPERGQPFSNSAKNFVSQEIYGKTVKVQKKGVDKYKRTIGFVLYDNKNLSLELLRKGLAWHYSYYSDDKEMAELELTARESKIGLWSDKHAINPYDWRKGKRNDN